jgi:hypothetical protein
MSLEIAREEYERIERMIASDESPVGIDAKHTHILILHKLAEIERRLDALEQDGASSQKQGRVDET